MLVKLDDILVKLDELLVPREEIYSKHNKILGFAEKTFLEYRDYEYDKIWTWSLYPWEGNWGKVDILAKSKNRYLNFEVKSSNWKGKEELSIKNLKQTEEFLKKIDPGCRVFNFYVYGNFFRRSWNYKIKRIH